jgi:hypothetical protein
VAGDVLDLRFPVGGLVKRYGYQSQPPYTTPDCMNVRAFDTFEGRERGGSRPGLTRSNGRFLLYEGGELLFTDEESLVLVDELPLARVQCLLPLRLTGETLLFGVADGEAFCMEYASDEWTQAVTPITGDSLDTSTRLQAAVIRQKVYVTNSSGPPHVFDPATAAVYELEASRGSVPEDYTAICRYRERLFLAGDGQNWHASRAGDPTDWDFFKHPPDAGMAMIGTCARRGEIGQDVIALMPSGDDYLLFGCESSLWLLQGDPLHGGAMRRISDEVGIVSATAWCELPDRSILLLAQSGLWLITPGGEQVVEFSQEALPSELRGVTDPVVMAYDPQHKGVHLSAVPADGSTGQHWWIDLRNRAFWPVEFSDAGLQPAAMATFPQILDGELRVVIGSVNGGLRWYDDSRATDDRDPLESRVVYGPVRAGGPFGESLVSEMISILDDANDSVHWTLQVADSGSAALLSSARSCDGEWAGGWNHVNAPRLSGGDFAIKVESEGQWAMESIGVKVAPAGRQR